MCLFQNKQTNKQKEEGEEEETALSMVSTWTLIVPSRLSTIVKNLFIA